MRGSEEMEACTSDALARYDLLNLSFLKDRNLNRRLLLLSLSSLETLLPVFRTVSSQ